MTWDELKTPARRYVRYPARAGSDLAEEFARLRRFVAMMQCPCGFVEERSRKEPCACAFGGIQNAIDDLEESFTAAAARARTAEEDTALLRELAQLADALKDPVANMYDGGTTRAVIVQRLQEWSAAHLGRQVT